MSKCKDITNFKFNRLTAIKFEYKKKNIHYWSFKCDCGKIIIARKNAVTSGIQKSCGCLQKEKVSKKGCNEFIIKENYAIMIVERLKQKIEVLLDKEDVERVKNIGRWHALYDKTLKTPSYYICNRGGRSTKKRRGIRLHRYIMNCPDDMVVDHINHNTLDNRKQNLKICTQFDNQQNLRSKVCEQTGVYQRKKTGLWVANITKNKKRFYKEFKTKKEAILKRKEWEKELYNKGGDD